MCAEDAGPARSVPGHRGRRRPAPRAVIVRGYSCRAYAPPLRTPQESENAPCHC